MSWLKFYYSATVLRNKSAHLLLGNNLKNIYQIIQVYQLIIFSFIFILIINSAIQKKKKKKKKKNTMGFCNEFRCVIIVKWMIQRMLLYASNVCYNMHSKHVTTNTHF